MKNKFIVLNKKEKYDTQIMGTIISWWAVTSNTLVKIN